MRYFLGFGLKKVLFISDAVHTNAINESFLDMADVQENLQPAITFLGLDWLTMAGVSGNQQSDKWHTGVSGNQQLEFRVTRDPLLLRAAKGVQQPEQ